VEHFLSPTSRDHWCPFTIGNHSCFRKLLLYKFLDYRIFFLDDCRVRRFGNVVWLFLDKLLRTGFRPIFGLTLTACNAVFCIAAQDNLT
jgi:hypothetical protein